MELTVVVAMTKAEPTHLVHANEPAWFTSRGLIVARVQSDRLGAICQVPCQRRLNMPETGPCRCHAEIDGF